MKRTAVIILAICLVCGLFCGCGSSDSAKPSEKKIVIFAAASLTDVLTEIGEKFMEEHEDVRIVYNFDSSGTLKTQIQNGAVCDLFFSAGIKQVDQLDINADSSKNPEGLDFIDSNTRINLLSNDVVLCVPDGNPREIKSFEDLAEKLKAGDVKLSIGNSDTPVGQYTLGIFAYFGLDDALLSKDGCISYASNVREVLSQVKEASSDCGIVYKTDAFSANLAVTDVATKEMCGQVVYPAAMLKASSEQDTAKAFLEYVKGEFAGDVFRSVGFTPIK